MLAAQVLYTAAKFVCGGACLLPDNQAMRHIMQPLHDGERFITEQVHQHRLWACVGPSRKLKQLLIVLEDRCEFCKFALHDLGWVT
eukprot:scaffold276938_cov32-Tisochrysis_lutea.AAC.2